MGTNGYALVPMDTHGYHGYLWVSMGALGCPGVAMGIYGVPMGTLEALERIAM
jgi:hypothetical protein